MKKWYRFVFEIAGLIIRDKKVRLLFLTLFMCFWFLVAFSNDLIGEGFWFAVIVATFAASALTIGGVLFTLTGMLVMELVDTFVVKRSKHR